MSTSGKTETQGTKGGIPSWSRLDNVAKLFPSVLSDRLTNLFRLSVTLTERVSRGLVQEALESILPRFPYFQARIRAGWFWYSLIYDDIVPQVIPDGAYPCMPLKKGLPELQMFRVRVYENRISLEINHALTDGTGALELLKALLGEYLHLRHGIPQESPQFSKEQEPAQEEWEDAFSLQKEKGLPHPRPLERAFRLPWKPLPKGFYLVTTGYLSVSSLKKNATAVGSSITEYLLAHLFLSFLKLQSSMLLKTKKKRMPVTLFLPVNLRPHFQSRTMRNFFLTVPVTMDPRLGEYSFEEICDEVRLQTALETKARRLKQRIAFNRRGEVITVMRLFPLFLKNWVISAAFSSGSRQNSGSLSNLGLVKTPDTWKPYIQSFEFIPPPNPINKTAVSIISHGDVLAVSFGRMVKEPELERLFFTGLRKSGLAIRVESNYGE